MIGAAATRTNAVRPSVSLYRRPRRAAGEGDRMLVKLGFQKSVVFLCEDRFNDDTMTVRRTPVASGFLVGLEGEQEDDGWVYLVTARHIVEDGGAQELIVRMNRKDQGYEDFPTERDSWFISHDDDVAALPFLPSQTLIDELDFAVISSGLFIADDYRFHGNLSPINPPMSIEGGAPVQAGDEVYFVGLFAQHSGSRRNLPIVRYGRISRMPEEFLTLPRFRGEGTFDAAAYLVECTSWKGNSGAPVLWAFSGVGLLVNPQLGIQIPMPAGSSQALLGLVSAHYPSPETAKTTGDLSGYGEITTDLNSGIAAITPAEAIRALLLRDDVVADREERRKDLAPKVSMPTMDSAQVRLMMNPDPPTP